MTGPNETDEMGLLYQVLALIEQIRSSGAYERRELPDIQIEHPGTIQDPSPLLEPTVAEGFAPIEARNHRVLAIVMNALNYADFRKMRSQDFDFDVESQAKFLRLGLMGTIDGAMVITARAQPVGEVMFLGEVRGPNGHLEVSTQDIQVMRVSRRPRWSSRKLSSKES